MENLAFSEAAGGPYCNSTVELKFMQLTKFLCGNPSQLGAIKDSVSVLHRCK